MRCRSVSLQLATRRPGHVRDEQDHQKYQRYELFWAILGEVMRHMCRDPRERKSSVGPLFEPGEAGDDEGDRAQELGDSENDAQVLWISDMRKSLNRLRTT